VLNISRPPICPQDNYIYVCYNLRYVLPRYLTSTSLLTYVVIVYISQLRFCTHWIESQYRSNLHNAFVLLLPIYETTSTRPKTLACPSGGFSYNPRPALQKGINNLSLFILKNSCCFFFISQLGLLFATLRLSSQ
jgi:hypothetical protein